MRVDCQRELHINNLAVHPGYRGRGVASQLLDEMLIRAYAKEVTVGYLEVRASNEAAAELYKAYGFAAIGRRRNYYEHPREDAIVMRGSRCDLPRIVVNLLSALCGYRL